MSKYADKNNQQNVMLRKEKAGEKAASTTRKFDFIKYEVLEDGSDITILSGLYINRSVRELWSIGPAERDYIVEKLWSTGDEKVVQFINSLVCE